MNSLRQPVEVLQDMQLMVLTEPYERKLSKTGRAVEFFRLDDFCGQCCWIEADDTFGVPEHTNDKTMMRFEHPMSFRGQFSLPGYIYDEDLPIDSLTLRFLLSETGSDNRYSHLAEAFRSSYILNVPILSVMNIIELDA